MMQIQIGMLEERENGVCGRLSQTETQTQRVEKLQSEIAGFDQRLPEIR